MTLPEAERRKYKRYESKVRVKFSIAEDKELSSGYITAVNKNLSAQGICFISERHLKPGDSLDVNIYLPFGFKPLNFKGEVRWSFFDKEIKGKKFYSAGILLISLNEKDRDRFIGFVTEKGLIYSKKI